MNCYYGDDIKILSCLQYAPPYHSVTCDPGELGDNPTSVNSSGMASISNGVVMYNGVDVGSTTYLKCDEGYVPEADSNNRTCGSDGIWDGRVQICQSSCKNI